MATASSLLRLRDSSYLPAFRVGGRGVRRPVPPCLSWFATCSSLQKNLYVVPVSGPNSRRTASPPSSSLGAFRGHTLPRYPTLLAYGSGFRLNTVGVPSPSFLSNMTRLRAGAVNNVGKEENSSELVIKDEDSGFLSPRWPTVGLTLFCLGFLLGPPLDGIHSRVQLQVYDNGAINLFGLQTNIWVPPMLGVFYSLAGLLQLILDKKFAPKGNITASLTKIAASFVSLAVLLELSAEMYLGAVPFNIEGYILFFLAELNWVLLENTWWGFGLAAFIGVVCPLAEIPIVKLFGLWHYPKANVDVFGEGFISWVICCYFFYTPFISNLARWLSSYQKEQGKLSP